MGNTAAINARILAAIGQIMQEVPHEARSWPEVHFKHLGVQPPAALYVTQSEFLVVKTLSSVANPALTVSYRLLGADGQVSYNQSALANLAAGSINTQLFPMREGFLIDICVSAFGSTIQRGQTFVSLSLQFGNASGQTPFNVLAADYVTNSKPLAWPEGPIATSVDGPGSIVSLAGSVPAAGAEATFTVPAATRLRVYGCATQITTSAAGTNRNFRLVIDDGTNALFEGTMTGSDTFGINTTAVVSGGSGVVCVNTPYPHINVAFPVQAILGAGWRVRTLTGNIDVGDQYTALRLAAEQWIEL
jgi:hypothetical protein